MKYAIIDGRSISSMEEIHQSLAQQLSFPEWYGGNLDALHDCLTDFHEEVEITVVYPDALQEILGSGYILLCRVLSDAADANPYLKLHL